MVRYRFSKQAKPPVQRRSTIKPTIQQPIPMQAEPVEKPTTVVVKNGKRIEIYRYRL